MIPESFNTESETDDCAASFDEAEIPAAEAETRGTIFERRKVLTALAITSVSGATAYSLVKETDTWKNLTAQGNHWKDRFTNRFEREWDRLQESLSQPSPTPRTLESEKEYAAFLGKIPLQFITPEEVIRPHRNIRNGVPNELPPRSYWARIEKTLLVADQIRRRLKRPLHLINSAYRSPSYNKACPGTATWSYHMKNQALDLMFTGGSTDAAEVAKKLRAERFFKGGIGTYPNFIHIDTRGSNATWEA